MKHCKNTLWMHHRLVMPVIVVHIPKGKAAELLHLLTKQRTDLGSQRKSVLSPSALHTSHSLKDGWQNMRVLSRRLMRKHESNSIRCWKSSHGSSPWMKPALMAWNSCSSVRGCSEASATLRMGSDLSKAELVMNFMLHCSW